MKLSGEIRTSIVHTGNGATIELGVNVDVISGGLTIHIPRGVTLTKDTKDRILAQVADKIDAKLQALSVDSRGATWAHWSMD